MTGHQTAIEGLGTPASAPAAPDPARPPVAVPALPVAGPARASAPPHATGVRLTDRPWAQASFWILQLVVLALYLIRLAAIVGFDLDTSSLAVEFSTFTVFLIPTVFAALRYGFAGAVVTAAWVSVLAVPRFLGYATAHQYVAAWAELLQIVLLNALALLIGQGVSAERTARRMAESAKEAHLSAEALYRELFDSNKAPILIVDAAGYVEEANAAAMGAFPAGSGLPGRSPVAPGRARLVDMIGPEAAGVVLTRLLTGQTTRDSEAAGTPDRVEPVPFDVGGRVLLYRPTVTRLGRSEDDRRIQVVFEDVTNETRRHDLMEAYAARVVLGQEEERRHIAQELHDGPVQSLVHLCRQIDAIGSRSAGESIGRPLSDLRHLAEGAVAELRGIAKGLRPSILDDLGFVASIQQLLSEAAERQGFEASFGSTGVERRLPPAVELALFRIAQEALSNIERHAAARRVAIGIDFESGTLRMLIKDDGVGFDSALSPGERGSQSLGLPGMVERANLVGARLAVHSAPGAGTTIDVSIPATIID